MVSLKHKEKRIIDDAFDMHGGYVLDFSDRTFAEFFEDEFDIHIYDAKYMSDGKSKAKVLRAFISLEDAHVVAKVLRKLWGHKESMLQQQEEGGAFPFPVANPTLQPGKDVKSPLFNLINKIEDGNSLLQVDVLENFSEDETLEELIAAIKRDTDAGKPATALDRLHTYCMKKLTHLIAKHGGSCDREEPLHGKMGKYIKLLEKNHNLNDVSVLCLKSSISILDKFNSVRNNQSLAHDNPLLNGGEARYIFEIITALLRFIKTIEAEKYESS